MTAPGPRGLTQQAAQAAAGLSDLRTGVVQAVTSRGIDVRVGVDGLIPDAAHLNSYAPAVGDPVSMIAFQGSWLVLGRPVGPGTARDNVTPGSAAGTTLIGATVLTGTSTTLASSTGSAVVVPRMTMAYYHPPGHYVLIMAGFSWFNNIANDWLTATFSNANNGVTLADIQLIQAASAAAGHWETLPFIVGPSQGGKPVSLKMTIQRLSGTGTVRVDDSGPRVNYLIALDLGDQSVIPTQ